MVNHSDRLDNDHRNATDSPSIKIKFKKKKFFTNNQWQCLTGMIGIAIVKIFY
jgi:hypothetical protein